MKKLFLVISFFIITFGLYGKSFIGKCVGVSDGDTISVMKNGKAVKIRLDGVDCPEKSQAFGKKAKKFTSNMVFGKIVKVIYNDKDSYGRIIGKVLVKNQDLSFQLVKNGFAWHYKKYNSSKILSNAQAETRAKKIGLWSDINPTPPWEYRRKKGRKSKKLSKTKIPLKKYNGKKSYATQCLGITLKGYQCKRRTKNSNGYCWQHEHKKEKKQKTYSSKKAYATQCLGTTKKGRRCRRKTKNSSGYCWQHE